jgi:hemolysin activation/secretion protein
MHRGCIVSGVVGLCLALQAQAQAPQDLERAAREQQQILQQEQQRQRQERELEERRRRAPSGQDLTPKPSPAVPEGGACSQVGEIVLEGATKLGAAEQARLAAPYLGRCLTLADINRLIGDITNRYVELGFVTTRVYIPQQDLGGGRLELKIIEGVLRSLRVVPPDSASAATAFPGLEGEVLNLRDLEQGIDQVNRLGSNAAKIDIEPDDEPGTSRVVIRNEPRQRWLISGGVDNSGSESTGRAVLSASLGLDHALGLNDFFSLGFRHSEEPGPPQYSDSASVYASIPYGYWTFSASFNQFRYASVVEGAVSSFSTAGDSTTTGFRAERVMYRDQAVKWSLAGGLTGKRTRNYIAATLIEVSSTELAIADFGTSLSLVGAGMLLSFDLGYAQGLDSLGAAEDDPARPTGAPQAQFTRLSYGATLARPFAAFGKQAAWRSALSGQRSHDSLYGTEQIAIGSLYTVRGFRRTSLSGRSGYYARNDLGVQLPFDGFLLRPYAGYDFGYVEGAGTLQGWTLGLDVGISGGVTLQFAWSAPTSVPSGFDREGGWLYARFAFAY